MNKRTIPLLTTVISMTSYVPSAFALGECGLSCCIGSSTTSGVTLAPNLGISVQYENATMETIREGTDEVSPDDVLNRHWRKGSSYAIPTEMTMEKLSITAAYPATERLQVLAVFPYVRNDMGMRVKNPMGMVMDHKMSTIKGLGDVSMMGLYTAYTDAPIRPTQRLTLGFGLKTPTGKNDEKTVMGSYVHAMMQAGTGSWDPLLMVNYMQAFYPLILQANLFYHVSMEGDEGYEFGDQLSYNLLARYQVANYVNLGLDLNGIHAGKDQDHDGKFSKAALSMVDNPDNTGLDSLLLSPSIQFKIPNSGGNVELKYQVPLYQNVNGYQQVIDQRWLFTVTWNF